MRRFSNFALAIILLAICIPSARAQYVGPGDARTHEQLDAALWVQSSAEFYASARQAFAGATEKLALALRDPTWTASTEQFATGNFDALPPAVIVNLDETVWNNSPYQARIILQIGQHDMGNFIAWCNEAKCPAVPGAKEFLVEAKKLGVSIVYITPRPEVTRDGTLRNLQRLDYPYDADKDRLIMAGGWPNHDKREDVARGHRILLIVSDNLGDFMHDTEQSAAVRREMAARYADYWGLKWFILPNPMYGHWEYSFQNYDYDLDRPTRIKNKLQALEPELDEPLACVTSSMASIFQHIADALRAKLSGLPDPRARDEDARTPLHEAAVDNRLDEAKSLIDRGADVNAQDYAGFTPLHYAAQNYFPELAALLITRGANLELEDRFGNSPLWRAAMNSNGRGEVIRVLLAAGADPHHKNKSDASPLDVANTIANFDVKQFFGNK